MTTKTTKCRQCSTLFGCGAQSPHGCWCMALPRIPVDRLPDGTPDPDVSCLCPECLKKKIAATLPGSSAPEVVCS